MPFVVILHYCVLIVHTSSETYELQEILHAKHL